MIFLEQKAAILCNRVREQQGLSKLDYPTLRYAGDPKQENGVIIYTRDGWLMSVNDRDDELLTVAPIPFNYEQPRCPFTGELFDEDGPVKDCEHSWESIGDNIEQCSRCRLGRLKS